MSELNFRNFGLSEEILESIEKLGYKTPSEVQEKVIPLILNYRDVIAKSQTGSGKTAAFAIPICERLELEENDPQVLVLSPTRELSLQIKQDFLDIGRFKRLRCAAIFGKEPIRDQIKALKQRIHIIAGTPGRILDHIRRNTINLKKIKYLVIDEADEMLSMGFIDEVTSIIRNLPKSRLTLLFSATMTPEIVHLCNTYMRDPVNIEITSKSTVADRIDQLYYEVERDEKPDLLNKIIYSSQAQSSIIFCRTKDNVDEVFLNMKKTGFSCDELHGGMLQNDRTKVINRFKRGEFMFLVATDVAARGLDVENITHVINYDIPMEQESYVHRIGRTGRAGKNGIAITFVSPREYRFLKDIEEHFGFEIKKGVVPSAEEVKEGKLLFTEKQKIKPELKIAKNSELNEEITKIYISAGKKKKIRPGDIAGTISSIDGVNPDDIGIIEIQDTFSYVDILAGKGNIVLEALKNKSIKGKTIRVAKAQK